MCLLRCLPSGNVERDLDDLLVGQLLVAVVVQERLQGAAVLVLHHHHAAALPRPAAAFRPWELQLGRPHGRAHELHAYNQMIVDFTN